MQIFVAKVELLILYLDRCLIYLDYFLRILNPESKYCTKKTFQHIYGHCLAAQRTFDLLAQRCPNNHLVTTFCPPYAVWYCGIVLCQLTCSEKYWNLLAHCQFKFIYRMSIICTVPLSRKWKVISCGSIPLVGRPKPAPGDAPATRCPSLKHPQLIVSHFC